MATNPSTASAPVQCRGIAPVQCRGITVAYADTVAADQISFTVNEGEVFGLLGPNGAGKTSIIRALTTILEPRAGTATIAGVPLADHHRLRARIGVLPESSGYPKAQTGRSYLQFFGELFGLSRRDARSRADLLLEQLGLAHTNKRISTYSRGMRQRLGLCRALINDPAVLFLDEPTLGLDPSGKEEIVRHLANTAATRGTAVVLCTHLLDEVERVCDRVAIMDHGRLVIDGTIEAVVAAAAVAGSARVRVRPSDVATTSAILDGLSWVSSTDFDNSRPGDIFLNLNSPDAQPANKALNAVMEAGVEVLAFDNTQASLNDAFLALTGART